MQRFLNRVFFVLLLVSVLIGYLLWSAPSLEKFEGQEPITLTQDEVTMAVHKVKVGLEKGDEVRLSEEGLNQFVNAAFQMEQSFALNPFVEVEALYFDCSLGLITIGLERKVLGFTQYSEISYSVIHELYANDQMGYKYTPVSGVIGKLKLPVAMVYGLTKWQDAFWGACDPFFKKVMPYIGGISVEDGSVVLLAQKREVVDKLR